MFKFLMEIGIIAIVVLMTVTQVMIPLFVSNLDFFWLFKRSKAIPDSKLNTGTTEPDVKGAIKHLTDDLRDKRAAQRSVEANVDEAIDALKNAKRE